jgi:hypothetical protein
VDSTRFEDPLVRIVETTPEVVWRNERDHGRRRDAVGSRERFLAVAHL